MIDINKHPIWSNISSYKKPAHMLRLYMARKLVKLYPRSTFIGITGSVGKTTTKEAAMTVLSQKYKTLATRENLDPILNIPLTILQMRPGVQKVILELGIEYPGEMEFYLSIVKPAIGIITRLSFAHSEFLGDLESITREKSQLIKQLPEDGFAILNYDDLNARKLAKETKAQTIFFGTDPKSCTVWAGNIRIENFMTKFELNYGVERVSVTLKLLGKHFVYPALAAAALGIVNEMTLFSIKKGLESVELGEHRLQIKEGVDGWYVLDDTYNSSPVAVEESLNVLNEVTARHRIAVLGEMRELGIYSEDWHRKIAQKIYKDKVDYVLLGGGDARYIGDELVKLGFPDGNLEVNLTNSQIVSLILKIARKGDVVLIKGSRALKLDEVVQRVTKQK